MPRRDRSRSPDSPHKKVRQSAHSRSPSPTRRYHQRSRYDDDRDRDRERDRNRDRDRRGHDRRDRDRDRDHDRRDRDKDRDRHRRDDRRRSRSAERERPRENGAVATPPSKTATPPVEDEKMRAKRERLEAWKRDRGKKSLGDAKAKAMALAGKQGPSAGAEPTAPKAVVQLNRSALGSLPLRGLAPKTDLKKQDQAVAAMDDDVETTRKLERLEDMPAIDMSMPDANDPGSTVGENLEVDEDDTEANKMDIDRAANGIDEEDEVDPLDAFMSNVTAAVKKVNANDRLRLGTNEYSKPNLAQRLNDDQGAEDADNGSGRGEEDDLDTTELNPEDILALAAKKAKKKDVAAVDHSKIAYEPFRKEFYHPPPDVLEMTEEEADLLRLELDGIKIRGVDCPKPITKWSHCGLPASCLDVIKRLNFTAPTSIQSQAIPAIMSGRDMIGVAKTGSGKTMAFLLPLFRHIKDQRPLEQMEGPLAMVMTPTRELAVQIHRDCKPFLKVLNLRAVCAYGGSPIKDQIAEMKKGAEIIVCTPGRMIDLLTANSGRVTNLKRITYLVLDEADRMFDMGFEPQVMKIINNVRPDRQTVLFSATFPRQMDSLARKILQKPLEITVGGRSVVAPEIEQIVEVRAEDTKFTRLLEILGQTYNEDPECRTLIFVDRQEAADNLLRELMRKGYLCLSLHGGKDQVDRDQTLADFKAGVVPILTATSVAARGLDVKQLKLVINYDAPNHMEDYVHRAGRTGRAGNKGTCVTFITEEQERYSVDIYRALKASSAPVPEELNTLANGFLEKVKAGKAKVAGSGFGGKGLDRLDQERDAKEKAERRAYGEGEDGPEKVEETPGASTAPGATGKTGAAAEEDSMTFGKFKVEIKRGRAPDSTMGGTSVADAARMIRVNKLKSDEAALQKAMRDAEEEAKRSGRNSAAYKNAQNGVAKLNALIRASKLALHGSSGVEENTKKRDVDISEFHAVVPINDYPQKARWKVTNKETMSLLVEETGASVTNKGIYYEAGKEPVGPEAPPKLHLLVESNDEMKVEHAVREIKRLLIEAATSAIQAEQRNPGMTAGRYSVV